jgi:hypothetical protein
MTGRKRKLPCRKRQLTSQLEKKLVALDARIAMLMRDPKPDQDSRDHFSVWRRPPLFDRDRNRHLH